MVNQGIFHPEFETGRLITTHKDEMLVDFEKIGQMWIDKSECEADKQDFGLYFAYGSNLHIDQMLRRCKDARAVRQGILLDHELTYRSGVATVEPKKGSQVLGALYHISKRDLKQLDIYEGYPHLYYREQIQVETHTGMMDCMVYKMHTTRKKSPPSEYYLNTIVEGYRHWGLPIKKLRKHP